MHLPSSRQGRRHQRQPRHARTPHARSMWQMFLLHLLLCVLVIPPASSSDVLIIHLEAIRTPLREASVLRNHHQRE